MDVLCFHSSFKLDQWEKGHRLRDFITFSQNLPHGRYQFPGCLLVMPLWCSLLSLQWLCSTGPLLLRPANIKHNPKVFVRGRSSVDEGQRRRGAQQNLTVCGQFQSSYWIITGCGTWLWGLNAGLFRWRGPEMAWWCWWCVACDWWTACPGWIGKGSQGRGLEEGLNADWWRLRAWRLNLANGSAGVELILFALELSGLRIRELCLYAKHLLSIMMSHSRKYHVPWQGWISGQTGCHYNEESILMRQNHLFAVSSDVSTTAVLSLVTFIIF